jgi:hypothetical protein
MRKSIILTTAIIPLVISSCAKRPNAVVATSLPSDTYAAYTCAELAPELTKAEADVSALSAKQTNAANADAVGVFLVAVPVGSLTNNDVEGELSVAKGKVLAIKSQQIAKKCSV